MKHIKLDTIIKLVPIPLAKALPEIMLELSAAGITPTISTSSLTVFLLSAPHTSNLFVESITKRTKLSYIGLDTETQVFGSRMETLKNTPSTIQVAFGCGLVGIFQVYRMCKTTSGWKPHRFPQQLSKILQQKDCLKVGVGLSSDCKGLVAHFPVKVENIVDLDVLASSIGLPLVSLGALAYLYCSVELDKRKKMIFSSWDSSNLGTPSLMYAANDAEYSRRIYTAMVARPPIDLHVDELRAIVKRNK